MVKRQGIAHMSGYSIGTVSRVINNGTSVSEKARAKIETVIREQRFRPNTKTKMLRQSISSAKTTIFQQDSEARVKKGVDDLLIRLGYESPAAHEKVPYRYVPGESVAQPRE